MSWGKRVGGLYFGVMESRAFGRSLLAQEDSDPMRFICLGRFTLLIEKK